MAKGLLDLVKTDSLNNEDLQNYGRERSYL